MASANTLKSVLHEVIAERFESVIFPQSPFFYEMGVRWAANWGILQHGAPREYLDLISGCIMYGHNVFVLINDDVIIPSLVRAGKTVR